MDKLPEKWGIKWANPEQARIIMNHFKANRYSYSRKEHSGSWMNQQGHYFSWNEEIADRGYTEIHFQDFERLVLNKPEEVKEINNYLIY